MATTAAAGDATLAAAPGPARNRKASPPALLALVALGVVFGDIGTSPLYAFKQCFTSGAGYAANVANVLGILSLIFWALVLVVCVKYATFVLRADHEGEGGTLALLALLVPTSRVGIPPTLPWFAFLMLLGAAMLYGDGVITPAISVLSAVEGVGDAANALKPAIVPVTVAILIGLFFAQSRGTGRLGRVFGPVMLAWFLAIGVAGLIAVVRNPSVFAAIDPRHAFGFLIHNGPASVLVLGAVVLAVSGVEALYADLGHFGPAPIRLAWYAVGLPALLLNYFGQGATVLRQPHALDSSPFYALFSGWTMGPMVALATAATIIASQALISGAFSLTQQAIQLGYLPRLQIVHTSSQEAGQVYLPVVNWLLAIACIVVVLAFRSSDRLGSAYGLAVTVTMLSTSLVYGRVARKKWAWHPAAAYGLTALFLVVDLAFFAGNVVKLLDGAWVPAVIALVVFSCFVTWDAGRRRVALEFAKKSSTVADYEREERQSTPRSSSANGTAVFLTPNPKGVPFVLRHEWLSNHVLQERLVILTILNERRPVVRRKDRILIENVSAHVTRVVARYGYMQAPSIDDIRTCCTGDVVDFENATFYLPHPRLVHESGHRSMPIWQRALYVFMARNSTPLTDSLGLPVECTIEFGVKVPV